MAIAKYKYRNFYEMVQSNAENLKNKPALFEEDLKISHKELKEKVDSLARYFELIGVKKGSHVAILLGNSKEFIYSFLAIGKLGAVPIPINTFLKHDEI